MPSAIERLGQLASTAARSAAPRVRELRARVGQILTATDGRDILANSPDGWEVEQPWLWFDGPNGGDGTGGPFGNPPPGAAGSYAALPAAARCRSLICDTLAGMPWEIYRGRERLRTPDFITDPQALRNDERIVSSSLEIRLSAVEFWSSFLVSAVELGEGIVYTPARDAAGQPVPPLFMLNPADVDVYGGSYFVGDERLDADELIVLRNRVWPGKKRGHGVWDQFGHEIGFGHRIRDYADNMLGRGIPAGYLQVRSPDLSQDEADDLKAKWEAAHGGRRRRIAVLNAVTEFHPLQIDAQALQLTELLKLNAWQIALIYGIPPSKLGASMGESMTYSNVESRGIEYVQDALLPWARRIEATFDGLFPRGTEMKLNLDQLRRADTKSRYEAYKIALDAGILTPDEVREREDLEPMNDMQQRQAANYRSQRGKLEVS